MALARSFLSLAWAVPTFWVFGVEIEGPSTAKFGEEDKTCRFSDYYYLAP